MEDSDISFVADPGFRQRALVLQTRLGPYATDERTFPNTAWFISPDAELIAQRIERATPENDLLYFVFDVLCRDSFASIMAPPRCNRLICINTCEYHRTVASHVRHILKEGRFTKDECIALAQDIVLHLYHCHPIAYEFYAGKFNLCIENSIAINRSATLDKHMSHDAFYAIVSPNLYQCNDGPCYNHFLIEYTIYRFKLKQPHGIIRNLVANDAFCTPLEIEPGKYIMPINETRFKDATKHTIGIEQSSRIVINKLTSIMCDPRGSAIWLADASRDVPIQQQLYKRDSESVETVDGTVIILAPFDGLDSTKIDTLARLIHRGRKYLVFPKDKILADSVTKDLREKKIEAAIKKINRSDAHWRFITMASGAPTIALTEETLSPLSIVYTTLTSGTKLFSAIMNTFIKAFDYCNRLCSFTLVFLDDYTFKIEGLTATISPDTISEIHCLYKNFFADIDQIEKSGTYEFTHMIRTLYVYLLALSIVCSKNYKKTDVDVLVGQHDCYGIIYKIVGPDCTHAIKMLLGL